MTNPRAAQAIPRWAMDKNGLSYSHEAGDWVLYEDHLAALAAAHARSVRIAKELQAQFDALTRERDTAETALRDLCHLFRVRARVQERCVTWLKEFIEWNACNEHEQGQYRCNQCHQPSGTDSHDEDCDIVTAKDLLQALAPTGEE